MNLRAINVVMNQWSKQIIMNGFSSWSTQLLLAHATHFQSSNPSWSQSQWIVLRSSSCHKCFPTKVWKGLDTNTGMWINLCFSLCKTLIAMVAEKVDRQQTMQTIGVIYVIHNWFRRGIYFGFVQVVSTDNYEHLIRAAQLAFTERSRKHSVYELRWPGDWSSKASSWRVQWGIWARPASLCGISAPALLWLMAKAPKHPQWHKSTRKPKEVPWLAVVKLPNIFLFFWQSLWCQTWGFRCEASDWNWAVA